MKYSEYLEMYIKKKDNLIKWLQKYVPGLERRDLVFFYNVIIDQMESELDALREFITENEQSLMEDCSRDKLPDFNVDGTNDTGLLESLVSCYRDSSEIMAGFSRDMDCESCRNTFRIVSEDISLHASLVKERLELESFI